MKLLIVTSVSSKVPFSFRREIELKNYIQFNWWEILKFASIVIPSRQDEVPFFSCGNLTLVIDKKENKWFRLQESEEWLKVDNTRNNDIKGKKRKLR